MNDFKLTLRSRLALGMLIGFLVSWVALAHSRRPILRLTGRSGLGLASSRFTLCCWLLSPFTCALILHGLFAGTDSAMPVMQLLYQGSLLATVFLIVYWLVTRYQSGLEAKAKKIRRASPRLP
jgi:hypothetical protein